MTAAASFILFFFFNDTATTEIYTLSLHDALPIFSYTFVAVWSALSTTIKLGIAGVSFARICAQPRRLAAEQRDRKSTRLNSSHGYISYAVFCLKKKKDIHISSLLTYPTPLSLTSA